MTNKIPVAFTFIYIYIEKDIFDNIDNEAIAQHFWNMKKDLCKMYSIEMLWLNIILLYL